VVNTPPAIASVSDNIKAKSGKPEGFNPAGIPAARYPLGAVTPPVISCQSVIIFPHNYSLLGDYIKSLLPLSGMLLIVIR
jgi:hypothetical protein